MYAINTIKFESLPSTNTYVKKNITSIPVPSIIIADNQTAGRGRQGKKFYSPDSTGLYMTLVFELSFEHTLITCAAAIAVCNALEEYNIKANIKWVNDIFVEKSKVCGILTELFKSNNKSYVALGIGINLTTQNFPDDIPFAGSINIECDRIILANRIAEIFFKTLKTMDDSQIKSEYENRLFVLNKEIQYIKNGIMFNATVKGINELCHLIVEKENGETDTLFSGEISIKI